MSTFTARTLLLSLLFLLTGAMLFAQSQEEKPTSYARVELSTTPKYVGDSCLVSIVLYGNRPFVEFKTKASALRRIKGGTLRWIGNGNVNDQEQVNDNGRVMFAFVAQQYVLRCESAGKLLIPSQKFNIQLGTYAVEENPYDFFSPTRLRLIRRHAVSTKSPQQTLEITERPKRTTREVMRSGQQVI